MRRSLILLSTVAALTTACVERFNATQLGVPVTMASPAAEPAEGDRFRIRQTSIHAFWGIMTLKHASLENALSTQLVGGRGVTDVRITVRSRWLDILFTGLTLGLVVPRSVTFEGVVTGSPPPATPVP